MTDLRVPFTKPRLIKEISAGMSALGYGPVPGPPKPSAGLFYKLIDDLVLTVGLELSTRYKDRFTASYYLSRSFHWSYMLRGFPSRAYERVGTLLEPAERMQFLDPYYSRKGVEDTWWIGFNSESINSFLQVIRLTEPRFLGQPGLADEIRNSSELQKYLRMVTEVISVRRTLKDPPPNLRYQPSRYSPTVPREYYWAAESVLVVNVPAPVLPSLTELLAVDSWRIETLVER
jgi:hypothetical protein